MGTLYVQKYCTCYQLSYLMVVSMESKQTCAGEHNYDIFIQYVNESQDNFMNISVLKLLYRFKTKFDNLRCGNKTQRR